MFKITFPHLTPFKGGFGGMFFKRGIHVLERIVSVGGCPPLVGFPMAIVMLTAIACQTSSMAAQGSGTVTGDKTLVAWVSLRMTDRWGGSVLTLQRGNAYDGIVLGGDKEPTWIAGSDDSRRTHHEPDYGPQSLAESMLIQVAVAYQGDRITIYRNGRPLSSYRAENIDL